MKVIAFIAVGTATVAVIGWGLARIADITLESADFTEAKFSSIQVGMQRAEVLGTLGAPIAESCGTKVGEKRGSTELRNPFGRMKPPWPWNLTGTTG